MDGPTWAVVAVAAIVTVTCAWLYVMKPMGRHASRYYTSRHRR